MKNKIILLVVVFLLSAIFITGCFESDQTVDDQEKDGGDEQYKDDNKSKNEYQWSKMTEGPYHDKISYATSTDLLNWVDSQEILAEHASVPGAVIKSNVIYVYFVDVSVDGIAEQIGLIRSSDNGTTWSEKQIVSIDGVGEKVPVDPAPFLLDDGSIRIYYFDINEERTQQSSDGLNKIYSCISSDGLNFVDEGVICLSKVGIFDPDVVLVDDIYRMYVGDLENNQVISATSSDGLNFTEEGVALVGGAVPDVFFKNNTYYLYTAGIDISMSDDGVNFTKTENFFRSGLGLVTADPSVIELSDGTYMMLYKTK